MSGATRVGWCPSVVTPMATGDGLLVRIKPTASTISALSLRAIAGAAARCGNGYVDLTSRSNLQVRGLGPDTVAEFAEVARAQGVASADSALEEIRNVAADPLGPDDPDAVFDSHAIARALEAMLAAEPRLTALPPKFGILIDCGRRLPMPDARADIMIRADGEQLVLTLDGGASAIPCAPAESATIARRLALAFLDLAGPPDVPPYRMRELVAAVGEEPVWRAAGLAFGRGMIEGTIAPSHSASCPDLIRASTSSRSAIKAVDGRVEPGHDACVNGDAVRGHQPHPTPMYAPPPPDSPVGFLPFPRRGNGAFVVGVPRGRTDATTLEALAELTERFTDATIRLTPWRAFALAPIAAAGTPALAAALSALGLVTDSADPRHRLPGHAFEPLDRPLLARPGTGHR